MSRFEKKIHINISMVIFGALALYIIASIIMYFVNKKTDSYQVVRGEIVDYETYSGIAVRDEMDIKAESSGDITYLVNDGDKIAVNDKIYVMGSGETSDSLKSTDKFSDSNRAEIISSIESFVQNHDITDYSDVYEFESKTQNMLYESDDLNVNDDNAFAASADGVISLHTDTLDGITVSDIDEDTWYDSDYNDTNLRIKSKIKKGDIAYKIVTSEDWHIVIELTKERYEKLIKEETSKVSVTFLEDDITVNAGLTLKKSNGAYLGILNIYNSMVRYIDERFIEVKITYDSASGLKIPIDSITKKNFLTVPANYITNDGTTSDNALMKKENGKYKYVYIDVYYIDTTTNLAYISSDDVHKGDVVVDPITKSRYTLNKTGKLSGVYNVSKGYSVFKRINLLSKDDEYAIVSEGTEYGISNYDLIARDGAYARKNEL